MKAITCYETADGQLFRDGRDAKKHAEARYGEAMLTLAKTLVQIDKYTAMTDFLDANLERFAELLKLRGDIAVEEADEE